MRATFPQSRACVKAGYPRGSGRGFGVWALLLSGLCAFGLSACAAKNKDPESKPSVAPGGQLVGRVEYVDATYGFVLVRMASSRTLAPGIPLTARRGEEEVAQLRVSPQAWNPYCVADVVSGEARQGDNVFQTGAEP